MPYKSRKSKSRKRWYRRKRYSNNLMGVGKSPLPNKFTSKLRYCDQQSLNPGAGTTATQLYRANGLYDPDSTGVGNQPRGWDQMIALYNHAIVIGSRITVQFCNTGTVPVIVGVALRDDTTTASDVIDYIEGANCRYLTVGPNTGESNRTVSFNFNNKFLGISKPLASENLRNTASANASEMGTYHLFVAAADGSSDPGAITCVTTIEYITVFTERKDLAQS